MTHVDYRAALRVAENELQDLRGFKAAVAEFINDSAYDPEARRCLAQFLSLPAPRTTTRDPNRGSS
jgi:hypothetical protein